MTSGDARLDGEIRVGLIDGIEKTFPAGNDAKNGDALFLQEFHGAKIGHLLPIRALQLVYPLILLYLAALSARNVPVLASLDFLS